MFTSPKSPKEKWVESQKVPKTEIKKFKFCVYSNAMQKYIRSVPNFVNMFHLFPLPAFHSHHFCVILTMSMFLKSCMFFRTMKAKSPLMLPKISS